MAAASRREERQARQAVRPFLLLWLQHSVGRRRTLRSGLTIRFSCRQLLQARQCSVTYISKLPIAARKEGFYLPRLAS